MKDKKIHYSKAFYVPFLKENDKGEKVITTLCGEKVILNGLRKNKIEITSIKNFVNCPKCIEKLKEENWFCPNCGFLEKEQVTFKGLCGSCGRKIIE